MKIRKFTAVLLVLAMLVVPMLALGETASTSPMEAAIAAGRSTKTTISFVPGEMLTADPSMAPFGDLLKALRLETAIQAKDDAALIMTELFLQDKSSLSFTEIVDPKGQITVKSNLLGEKAVSFTVEEYLQWFISQMEMQGNAEMASVYKMYMQMYTSLMKGEMPTLPTFDEQSLQQDLIVPASEWATNLMSSPEVTTGTFESDKHDAAGTKVVYSVSAAQITDLLTIVTNWVGKDVNLDAILSFASTMNPEAGDLSAAKADIQAAIKAMPEEFAASAAAALQKPLTFTMLMDNSGNPVAYELGINVNAEDMETSVIAGYYVKTEADGNNEMLALSVASGTNAFDLSFSGKQGTDNWQMALNVKEDAAEAFSLKMDYSSQETADADAWKLNVEAGSAGIPIGVSLEGSSTTVVNGVDVKKDGKVDLMMAGQTAPIATILFTTETGEPLDIPAISDTDAVHPGKMTQEELQTWYEELNTNLMMQLGVIMQNLPASIVSMLSGGSV